MRASEREQRRQGRSGVMLRQGEGALAGYVDAADLTEAELREWVSGAPRAMLERIVYGALLSASKRRPRL